MILIVLQLRPTTKCQYDISRNDTLMPKLEKLVQYSCKNDQIVINVTFVDQLNVFRKLTLAEMKNIERYVYHSFKIRRSNFYYPFYNSIFIQNIELYLPNKEDVLYYLGKSGKHPE